MNKFYDDEVCWMKVVLPPSPAVCYCPPGHTRTGPLEAVYQILQKVWGLGVENESV